MTQEITFEIDGKQRKMSYKHSDDEQFIDVEVTPKEAIDIISALEKAATDVESGKYVTDLPVRKVRNIAIGGCRTTPEPGENRIMVSSQEEARVILRALQEYEPEEADFTDRLFNTFIESFKQASEVFDVDALLKLTAA